MENEPSDGVQMLKGLLRQCVHTAEARSMAHLAKLRQAAFQLQSVVLPWEIACRLIRPAVAPPIYTLGTLSAAPAFLPPSICDALPLSGSSAASSTPCHGARSRAQFAFALDGFGWILMGRGSAAHRPAAVQVEHDNASSNASPEHVLSRLPPARPRLHARAFARFGVRRSHADGATCAAVHRAHRADASPHRLRRA